jgi:hypothetical protein
VRTLALRRGERIAVIAPEWCDAFGVVRGPRAGTVTWLTFDILASLQRLADADWAGVVPRARAA